jgi:hypothetical protein
MAVPTETDVRLALDTGNTGKRVRTQSRVIGANTVHIHYFIPQSLRSKTVFHYSPAQQSVQAVAQDAVASGFFWLQNPAASGVDLVVRKMTLIFGTTNVATVTAPRIVLARFTFTGTPSGPVTTPAKRKTAEANAADMRMAMTGMVITLGALIASFIVPQMQAAGQTFAPPPQVWPVDHDPFEDDDVILVPSEGALLYQPDAGTASDPRRFTVNLRAEEAER